MNWAIFLVLATCAACPTWFNTVGWIDIGPTGTLAKLSNDQTIGPIPLGFNFNFYGQVFSSVYINSNGILTFANLTFESFPTCSYAPPQPTLQVLYEDLNPAGVDSLYYQSLLYCPYATWNGRCFVVQFNNYHNIAPGGGQGLSAGTFEAIILADGRIAYQYKTAPADYGWNAAIGIAGATGSCFYDCQTGDNLISSGLTVEFPSTGARARI